MSYKDKIGDNAYYIADNEIIKDIIIEGREHIRLNTGSNKKGKLLDPEVEYRFWNQKSTVWHKAESIFYSKEDVLNVL